MNIGDKVTWNNKHYYIMQITYSRETYYHITEPNKDGAKPKVMRYLKTDLALEHQLQEGWI